MSSSSDGAGASPPADAAASRRRHRHRPRYEQLGAPALLYRHVPSYTLSSDNANVHVNPPKPQWEAKTPPEIAQARSLKLEQRRQAQAQSFGTERERMNRAKMRHHSGAMLQLVGRYDEEYYRELNRSQSQPLVTTATKRRRREQAFPEYCAPIGKDLVAWGLEDDQREQLLAGFSSEKLGASTTEAKKNKRSRLKYYGLARNEAEEELIVPSVCRNVQPSPADYGNCLLVMPCCCASCKNTLKKKSSEQEDDAKDDHGDRRGWFVVHPSGDRLDAIAVTRIDLPKQHLSDGAKHNKKRDVMPIGERILQVVQCGRNKGWNDAQDANNRILVVRTQTRCLVVKCSWVDHHESSVGTAPGTQCCGGGHYSLLLENSIDYFDDKARQRGVLGFVPIHAAASPYATGTSAYAPAVFAILSHSTLPTSMERHGILSESSAEPKQNVVHRAIVQNNDLHSTSRAQLSIQQHTIDKLCFMSQVEFNHSHPMVLWASGRSSVMHKPGLYHHGKAAKMMKRPLSGRGTNLYTVDLRSNDAALVFNPSHAERMVDGLHSISAILPDQRREHRVFIQSISAGSKVWEIDDRMPGKSLCSWAMPGLCEDWGVAGRRGGLFGWGSLLSQPVVTSAGGDGTTSKSDVYDVPVLGLVKSYGAAHLGVYQRPEVYPRFCTQSFEASFNNTYSGSAGFAFSSSFPLPDVSENVFNCGLAAFETSLGSFLGSGDIDNTFGRDHSASISDDVLCVISITSRGDLYGHALMDSCDDEKRVARSFNALNPGSCAVACAMPISEGGGIDDRGGIKWELCNTFPVQSSAILPQPTSKDAVRQSITFGRHLISSNADKPTGKKFKAIGLSPGDSDFLPLTRYEVEKGSDQEKPISFSGAKSIRFTSSNGTLTHCGDSSVRLAQESDVYPFSVYKSHTCISINTEKSCAIISGKAQKDTESDEDSGAEHDEEMEFGRSSVAKFRGDWSREAKASGKGKAQSTGVLRGRGRRLPMSSHRFAETDDEQIGSI